MQRLALWATCLAYTTLLIDGCTDDIPYLLESHVVSTIPSEGGIIAPNGRVTVTFDNDVDRVAAPNFTISGRSINEWTLTGQNLKEGDISVIITWINKDGSSGIYRLKLKVRKPDTTSPKVVSSSPKDGESGVDPAKVSKITVEFNEEVFVSGVRLAAIGGDLLQIKAGVKGKVMEVTFLGGAKLANETRYDLTGKVKDAAGNESDFKITFETMKEV